MLPTSIAIHVAAPLRRISAMSLSWGIALGLAASLSVPLPVHAAGPTDLSTPEAVLRALVKANADKDLRTMAALMAHDPDSTGYSIGGRKYLGWDSFAREMEQEFGEVEKLEIPILDLKVWTRDSVAWFAMELDYIRYVKTPKGVERTTLPLRETGVLERRKGRWIVVSWHESSRATTSRLEGSAVRPGSPAGIVTAPSASTAALDLAGEWLIEEEDKTYTAVLDRQGNGTYTHQDGTLRAVSFEDGRLAGTWHQTGNDREGGFEVLFAEDGNEARGVWWYTRVGKQNNIPPRLHGGTYIWKRSPAGAATKPARAAAP